jgi:hypothetical protein
MLGKPLVVQSYVIINEGCPLAITEEGTDHLRIACGTAATAGFEFVVQPGALRTLVALATKALEDRE